MAKWLKHYDPQPLIDRLNKSRTLNKDGNVQFGGFDIFVNSAHIDSMLELAIDLPDYEKRGLVESAIFKAGKKNITKNSLLKEVNLIERQYHTAAEKTYHLVSSISINYLRRKLTNKRVNGLYLSFPMKLPKAFVKARKHCNFFQYSVEKIDYPRDYLLAKVCVKARSTHQAARDALIGLNLYRSYLNFSNNLHYSYSFSLGAEEDLSIKFFLVQYIPFTMKTGSLLQKIFGLMKIIEDHAKPLILLLLVSMKRRLNWPMTL